MTELYCRNCYHEQSYHRVNHLECHYYDFKVTFRFMEFPSKTIRSISCDCKQFKPVLPIIDTDIPDKFPLWDNKALKC